jgi:hypothetical protein
MNINKIPNVFFTPWVGEYYFSQNGKKILVLGESHYCEKLGNGSCEGCEGTSEPDCELTNIAVQKFLDYKQGKAAHENWMNTFTRFTDILLGEQVDSEEVVDFWDNVVYYNYVQQAIEGPRIAPTEDDFINSEPAFFEVLKAYKPDLVIVWGRRLWKYMPESGADGIAILDGANGNFYDYSIDDKKIHAYSIPHPSSSKLSYEYHKYLDEAIKQA